MAKGKSSSGRSPSGVSSDPFGLLRSPVRLTPLVSPIIPITRQELLDVEDRRRFNPTASMRKTVGMAKRIGQARPAALPKLRYNPLSVMAVCARRGVRKQVLHALKKTGGAGGRQKRRRLSPASKIGC